MSTKPARSIFSKYLINDIPRGLSGRKLINSFLAPGPDQAGQGYPDIAFSLRISDSALDDELSVAAIDLPDTPDWLQQLNQDPNGFPMKIIAGTLWRGVDTIIVDESGRTEFMRAAMSGNQGLQYTEILAEFSDTDVNIQDKEGRTALH